MSLYCIIPDPRLVAEVPSAGLRLKFRKLKHLLVTLPHNPFSVMPESGFELQIWNAKRIDPRFLGAGAGYVVSVTLKANVVARICSDERRKLLIWAKSFALQHKLKKRTMKCDDGSSCDIWEEK